MRTPLVLLAISAAALSQAGTILGLDNDGIYRIDTLTGVSTLAASISTFGTGDANALAYDAATGTAYFQRNGDLYRGSLANGVFGKTGTSVGDIADATYANGAYIYGTSTSLKSVNVANGTTSTIGTYDKGWSFGDVATSGSTLYGSAGSSVFKVDLASGAYTSLSNAGQSLQLAFAGSTLFGIANGNAGAGSGSLFTVDTTTGVLSNTGVLATYNGSALAIRDAATFNPVPEPTSVAALAFGALGVLRRRRKVATAS